MINLSCSKWSTSEWTCANLWTITTSRTSRANQSVTSRNTAKTIVTGLSYDLSRAQVDTEEAGLKKQQNNNNKKTHYAMTYFVERG